MALPSSCLAGDGAVDGLEVDGLFREVQWYCRQEDRDRVQHGLWRSDLEGQVRAVEEKLLTAKARNTELARRAGLLERALLDGRALRAALLRPRLAVGTQPRAEDGEAGPEPPAMLPLAGEAAGGAAGGAAAGGAVGGAVGWRVFEARLPRLRKQLVRTQLRHALSLLGLELESSSGAETFGPEGTPASTHSGRTPGAGWASPGASPRDAGARLPGRGADETCVSRARSGGSEADDGGASGATLDGNVAGMMGVVGVGTAGPSWHWTATLRSHADAVRCVVGRGSLLVSCGDDAVIKVWDLSSLNARRRSWWEQAQPHARYQGPPALGRGSAVLALACGHDGAHFFSAGRDPVICAWPLKRREFQLLWDEEHVPYDACRRRLHGHTDVVWSLCMRPQSDCPASAGVLASAAADRTIRLWGAACPDAPVLTEDGPLRVLTVPLPNSPQPDLPTSLAWAPQAWMPLLVGFASATCAAFDVEHGVALQTTQLSTPSGTALEPDAALTSMVCHASLDLAVVGAGRRTHVLSTSTGQTVQWLLGPTDIVTAVALDPRGGYEVATGSHDGVLRLFDLRTGRCFQRTRVHEKKFSNEAFHSIFHGGVHLVTAGADKNIIVLSPAA